MDIMKYLMFSISPNLRFFVEFFYEQIWEKGKFDSKGIYVWLESHMYEGTLTGSMIKVEMIQL